MTGGVVKFARESCNFLFDRHEFTCQETILFQFNTHLSEVLLMGQGARTQAVNLLKALPIHRERTPRPGGAFSDSWKATLLLCGVLFIWESEMANAASWPETLACMPLHTEAHQLNQTNCVQVMLSSFQSNPVVKALIFMPGATDEFYMFGRAKAELSTGNPTLFDAIAALTNQTYICATFRPPLLLLHTKDDLLEPDAKIHDQRAADRIRQARAPAHILCNDRDWDYLQPILRWSLKTEIKPWRNSRDSWHFYRHSFAACNLTGWEALETAALAGKTSFTIRRGEVVFEVDRRSERKNLKPPKNDAQATPHFVEGES